MSGILFLTYSLQFCREDLHAKKKRKKIQKKSNIFMLSTQSRTIIAVAVILNYRQICKHKPYLASAVPVKFYYPKCDNYIYNHLRW